MTHETARRPALIRPFLALLVLLAGILAFQAAMAQAAPRTQVYTGEDAATPDLYRGDIDNFFYPDGSDASPPIGQAGTINLTLDGTPVVAFCVDSRRPLNLGTVVVDTVEQPMTSAENRAIAYVLLNSAPTGQPTPAKNAQAAAGQAAVWVIDGDLREVDPTDDAAFNAEVASLVATARSATATPASLALSATTPAAGATTSTITVTGRPGAVVSLAVTSGPGALSANQVTIGAGGTATVNLTASGVGTVAVSASTEGDGRLFRNNPTDDSQSTAYVQPTTLTASVNVAFQAAPSGPGTTPSGGPSGRPGAVVMRITKTGPARARGLSLVRYTLTVTNTSRATARNVVLRDVVPRGLGFVRSSRTSTIQRAAVVIRLGNLAPRASRTITVWMRATANVKGVRTNTATVSGANFATRRASARTIFTPFVTRVQPAVTG